MFKPGDIITSIQTGATVYEVKSYDESTGLIEAKVIQSRSNRLNQGKLSQVVTLYRPEQYRKVKNVMDY